MVDGRVIKAFRNVKRKLKKGSNARKRTVSLEEYVKLTQEATSHFRHVLILAFNTGNADRRNPNDEMELHRSRQNVHPAPS